MKVHHSSIIGDFDYDTELWQIINNPTQSVHKECLHWHGGNKQCSLPKGVKVCDRMFYGCRLGKGFSFGSFDTSDVVSMDSMFCNCSLPSDFTLGNKFNTANVKSMADIFNNCRLPADFSLGQCFDTSKVEDMSGMFKDCKMPLECDLGLRFNTANVKDMREMFSGCEFSKSFFLGPLFDTSKVADMSDMFARSVLPDEFSLGDKFDTSSVMYMSGMFRESVLPDNFSLGNRFNTANVHTMAEMFKNCALCTNFTLGTKFDTNDVYDMSYMFQGCRFGRGFNAGNNFSILYASKTIGMFDNYQVPYDYVLNVVTDISSVRLLISTKPDKSIRDTQHYRGDLGEFDYDISKWKISNHLKWIGGNQRCDLPDGVVKSCAHMFDGQELSYGFSLGDFGTKDVTDMQCMFRDCQLPDSFHLPEGFDTAHVTNMRDMFSGAKLPKGFKLNPNLLKGEVKVTTGMFDNAKAKAVFNYTKMLDIPEAMYKQCQSDADLLELAHKYCIEEG